MVSLHPDPLLLLHHFLGLYLTRIGGYGGAIEGVKLTGRIEYIVRDSSGSIKEREVIHNEVTTPGLGATTDRLFDETVTTSATGNEAFRAIYLTSDTVTASSIADGDAFSALGTATANVDNNPKNDSAADTSTDGTAIVVVQFTASGTATIAQIKLIRAPDDSPSFVGADVFASQDVTITLENGDSVTFTWTLTVS